MPIVRCASPTTSWVGMPPSTSCNRRAARCSTPRRSTLWSGAVVAIRARRPSRGTMVTTQTSSTARLQESNCLVPTAAISSTASAVTIRSSASVVTTSSTAEMATIICPVGTARSAAQAMTSLSEGLAATPSSVRTATISSSVAPATISTSGRPDQAAMSLTTPVAARIGCFSMASTAAG